MDKNPEATDDDKSMLRDEIARRQHHLLTQAVGDTERKSARKTKI